jgi:two-component system, cell cycle sensor histidine kinase and response regulator CckA
MAIVLVVDDRASNRELVRTLLGYGGHQVIEAHEGAEALAMAHAQHPDIVLTDILMPGMDGYELARELRAAPDTAATPIVFYTANYLEAETRPFAEACGVARVLLKSADPQVLMQTIDDVLAEERGAAGPVDTVKADQEYLRAVSAKLFDKSKALTDTETRFRLMADSSPIGIAFGDRHGSANYVNARLTEITGLPVDDLLGLGWLHCASDEDRDEILAVARGHGSSEGQHRHRSRIVMPDETLRWVNVHVRAVRDDGEHTGFIGTVDDVTALVEADQERRLAERRNDIEARDRATERLDSLSTLAGGVAHDFNNILGSVLAFENFVSESVTELTEAGRLDTETGRALLADLTQIRKGGERAAALTQKLLTLGGRSIINLSALDLNQAIRESNELLAPTIGAHIHIVTHLAADLRPVLAEPINVAQILLNLTVNAAHAMPDGGTLTIVTSNADSTDNPDEAGATPAGRYVRLTIRDTGHGMSPDTLARATEPFFTTKGGGHGSGLGLATVYGIVNQLGGVLRIKSAPDRGAAVTIHLPTADDAADQSGETPRGTRAPAGGDETILVAEDEDGIRDTLTRTLTKAGYTVLAAATGADALELAQQHTRPIHLLLSDVIMPSMLGDELAARLLERRPDTKVLFMSGYAGDLMNRYGVLVPGVTALPKPFTTAELLTAIRTMIDDHATH